MRLCTAQALRERKEAEKQVEERRRREEEERRQKATAYKIKREMAEEARVQKVADHSRARRTCHLAHATSVIANASRAPTAHWPPYLCSCSPVAEVLVVFCVVGDSLVRRKSKMQRTPH